MSGNIVELGRAKYPRRFYGECQRCQRTDYLPWATEHGERYCGQCHEKDALEYARLRGNPNEEPVTKEKIEWLINYWKVRAERSEALAAKVSGEGEAAEIYRDTEAALRRLLMRA